ncbi:gamma-glutamyltransferase [Chondrocystis sp. NIES-4102]|nr:gamma-glutamyltransferase [Chondrocystis sp. NIES-4102]
MISIKKIGKLKITAIALLILGTTTIIKNSHANESASSLLSKSSNQSDPQIITSTQGMVVSSQHLATAVGVEILKQGGNAVDAAVGVGYALAVVDPCCGNIGGGGFMVINQADGEEIFLNFRETAPLQATADMYVGKSEEASQQGYLSVAIPGTVKGLEYALANFGSLPRNKVMEGAIALAEEGYILKAGDIEILQQSKKKFADDPEIASIFKNNNQDYQIGDRLIQEDLANTLKQISLKGESVFYQGAIAQKLVQASQENGGIFTKEDFTNYQIEAKPPLSCTYRDYEILTTPPPGGGSTLCQMLSILEGYPQSREKSTQQIHRRLAAMLFAYRDRNKYLGDPNFVSVPVDKLIAKEYGAELRSQIGDRAIEPKTVGFHTTEPEGQNTTHYSVIDRWGNAVAVTYTINSYFGAGVVAPETGIILNNEMDDFTTIAGKPNQFGLIQGNANRIEPQKRPASSMTPAIVKKNDQVTMVTGSPGGSTIPTTVLNVILGVIDEGKNINQAVNTPKIHYQGQPNVVLSEPSALTKEQVKELTAMGYKIMPFRQWGAAESLAVEKNGFVGGQDLRRPAGSAQGF